jgi:hypothetical protein
MCTTTWILIQTFDVLRRSIPCHSSSFFSYDGEEGIDAGGVFKDWLGSISRELLKPGVLFLPCLSASGDSVRCLRINPLPAEVGVSPEAQVSSIPHMNQQLMLAFHAWPAGSDAAAARCSLRPLCYTQLPAGHFYCA